MQNISNVSSFRLVRIKASTLAIFLFLLFSTVLRYVEVFDVNLYFVAALSVLLVCFTKFNVLAGEILFFFLMSLYLLVGNIFLDFKLGATLLIASNFMVYFVARNLVEFYGAEVFVRVLVSLSIVHVAVAVIQFIFRSEMLLPSHYFESQRDLGEAAIELAIMKPSGLSLLASQFHLDVSFLIAYLLARNYKVISMCLVLALSIINLGKIFLAIVLCTIFLRKYIVQLRTLIVLILVVLLVFIQYPLLVMQFGSTPESVSTWTERIMIARSAILLYETSPWLGIGLDQFKSAATTYDLSQYGFPVRTDAHNIYVKAIVELGVVGLVSMALVVGQCVRKLGGSCKISYFTRISAILVLVQSGYHNYQFYNEIPLLLGLVTAYVRMTAVKNNLSKEAQSSSGIWT